MKAKLTFNLPDDQDQYDQYVAAPDMAMFIWKFSQYLRTQTQERRGNNPDSIDRVNRTFEEMLNNNNIDLDKIIQ